MTACRCKGQLTAACWGRLDGSLHLRRDVPDYGYRLKAREWFHLAEGCRSGLHLTTAAPPSRADDLAAYFAGYIFIVIIEIGTDFRSRKTSSDLPGTTYTFDREGMPSQISTDRIGPTSLNGFKM